MCQRAQCPSCNRPTYRGCGAHVEQVLADVPVAERCDCTASSSRPAATGRLRAWLTGRR